MECYNGIVGRVYPEINIYLTSPNSDAIPEPVWGIQDVRLRRDLNLGEHDPNLNPQFFNMPTAYLALIRQPNLGDILSVFWQVPSEVDFEPLDGFKLAAVPLGRFAQMWLDALDHACTTVFLRINDSRPSSSTNSESTSSYLVSTPAPTPSSPSSLRSHPKIKAYMGRIRSLLAQLSSAAATYTESLMIWCICQRNVLQMDAFITWMLEVAPFWGKPEARSGPLRSVIGTITDQPTVAENCLRVGIPVWFGRNLPVPPEIKVAH
ncbi:hypothetical protein BDP27DRAFT_1038908 [Rhodocollybia butyracea]|uniref:Uncharacterized protein n=1 Tax=Rhodocollybia butyracea TaxID=206335 RepID=A0A9P5Q6K2_9AGAR|nr:hypothetical protein BDP27DRAFT_1038908 [Rhodocollybia butyracea]